MRAGSRAALAGAILGTAAAVGSSCTDVSTAPGGVVSIQFDSLPSPSVVRGDTLRDVNGVATPVRAVAFDLDGDSIAGAPARYVYVPNDTVPEAREWIKVDSISGVVVATPDAPPNAQGRIAASVGSLPAEPFRITVVSRPDTARPPTAFAPAAPLDTLPYVAGDSSVTDRDVFNVKVVDSVGAPVQAYWVTYSVEYAALTVADSVRLSSDGTRPSTRVTTAPTTGIAGRRLRVFAKAGATGADTVVVNARVTYHGVEIPGSPVRLYVQLVRSTGG
jgi:hypothetical protein